MPAYRFCRSGDIPLLVEAHNTCFQVHFPDVAPMTVDDFKRDAREIDLWASSCMVAMEGKEPIGVLLAAKRERANRILRVGIHPDHRGQGHGRHMLESLMQKLAILGPRRMLAEVPESWTAGKRYLEACGYRVDRAYVDLECRPTAAAGPGIPPGLAELIIPVTVDELEAAGVFHDRPDGCWDRATESLIRLKDRLRGLAIGGGDRIEAWLLADDGPRRPRRDVMALHAADPARAAPLLGTLMASFLQADERPVRILRAHAEELDPAWLASRGFVAGRRTVGYTAEADILSAPPR